MPEGKNAKTILVVDDEPQVLAAMEDLLEDDFRVLLQTSPKAALKLLEHEPDLSAIISDQRMPGLSGHEFLGIASRLSDAPRILFTGYSDLDAVVAAVNKGQIFGYITKPWDPQELRRVVDKAVQHCELHRALLEEQRLLHHLMDSMPDAIFFKDRLHRFQRVNRAAARDLGVDSPVACLGKRVGDFLDPARAEAVEAQERMVLQTGKAVVDLVGRLGDRWVSATVAPVVDEQGQGTGLVGIARDVTDRLRLEERIARLTRAQAVLSGINGLIVRVHDQHQLFADACRIATGQGQFHQAWIGLVEEGRVVPVAADGVSLAALSPIEPELAPGRAGHPLDTIVASALRDQMPVAAAECVEGMTTLVLPLVMDRTPVGVMALSAMETDRFDAQEMALLREMAGNISFALDHLHKALRLDYLALYDGLTGLANRSLFADRLAQHVARARAKRRLMALVLVDVERFRSINDSLGLDIGDEVLREVARRLSAAAPLTDTVGRVGADCFGMLLPEVKGAGDVAHLVRERILPCFDTLIQAGGERLRLSARVGAALFPDDAEDGETLFAHAEIALNKAKDTRERLLFYATGMNKRLAQALRRETQLRTALENRQYVLHYQPKIDLRDGRVIGLEALIRWNEPGCGIVGPAEFIPLVEELGLIHDMGDWVMSQAVTDFQCWRAQGLKPPRIAVNVSALQLARDDFVDGMRARLDRDEAARACLDLEITESVLMRDIQACIPKIAALREMGVQVYIDDFGTGYSSLAYIARLPLTALKIDRAFVSSIDASSEDTTIVSTIIQLAHSLGLRVVAEGVETADQAKLLRLLRCDEMQGFLISRPVPALEIESLLAAPKLI
ncbi:PAS domain S-box-containing protein/diguanylate cyclase (GGDEF)-like protein [Nitrospirillum amazonense]|uniref:PAS domain S-box-containing protein/diguanylate cyclase (GGDEF)-like protein n=1 Tax=Nitrospirillum amazonense TaxID=28077 RepID=A0A560EXD7_9PROT|nr:EAL domain-containing protein [Nitrospirillum amazonense]TWB14006.1 PAS domain S-box-containing protein/diguanylate cyclase (GGDEF)-like protein [Nitrospirillum amazonense]